MYLNIFLVKFGIFQNAVFLICEYRPFNFFYYMTSYPENDSWYHNGITDLSHILNAAFFFSSPYYKGLTFQ
jgi:hypothetical protein